MITEELDLYLADRIWISIALLHQQFPLREGFAKDEIRQKLRETGLMSGLKPGSVAAHLKEHMVANVPPSSTKYRMLYETLPGILRLFREGDVIDPGRQPKRPSKHIPKITPKRDEIPADYRPLLDWYETWSKETHNSPAPIKWEDDPLIRLIGSGKHIWADEHADEYVERLREEPA
jgi:hypothetical protein